MTRLQAKRTEKGYTQEELAWLAKVHVRQYRRYESKKSVPSVIVAQFLAYALDSTVEELFEDIVLDEKERCKHEQYDYTKDSRMSGN